MNFSDFLGHSSNIVYLIAFALRDILWMRILMIGAAFIDIGYCFLGTNNPWTGVPWAIMAIAVNAFHFTKLLIDKGTINFNSEEREIHLTVFPTMSLLQFKHLLHIARWHTFGERAEIIKQGVECKDLILLIEGNASVEVDSMVVASLSKNTFAGEMSYLTNQPTTARVVSKDTVRCLLWKGDDLRKLMQKEPDLDMALQAVFNKILVKKLAATSLVAATRVPFPRSSTATSTPSLFRKILNATPALFRRKSSKPPVPKPEETGDKS